MRHDLNGDGAPSTTGATAYGAAFPNRVTAASGRMGCPAPGGCTGYELRADLTFDENGDGQITSADAGYWNGGSGWAPIGDATNQYGATFEGNGRTISHLYVNRTGLYRGLFGGLSGSVTGVGIVAANVAGGGFTGILTAYGGSASSITTTYATGRVSGSAFVGGLAGRCDGSMTYEFNVAGASEAAATLGCLG